MAMERIEGGHEDRLAHRTEIESQVKYGHFRLGGAVITIAAISSPGGSMHLAYGLSLCAPGDQFCRSKGRLAALARLIHMERCFEPHTNRFYMTGRTGMRDVRPATFVSRLRQAVVTHLAINAPLPGAPPWLANLRAHSTDLLETFEQLVTGPSGQEWREDG